MVRGFAPTTSKGCAITIEDNNLGIGLGDCNETVGITDVGFESGGSTDPCEVAKSLP